jgi:hypothetical protein
MKITSAESQRNQHAPGRPGAKTKPSKLSRLIARDTIDGMLADLDRGQEQLDDEMRTAWENKWADEHRSPLCQSPMAAVVDGAPTQEPQPVEG